MFVKMSQRFTSFLCDQFWKVIKGFVNVNFEYKSLKSFLVNHC